MLATTAGKVLRLQVGNALPTPESRGPGYWEFLFHALDAGVESLRTEAWAELHRDELIAAWNRLQQGRTPLPIEPLR